MPWGPDVLEILVGALRDATDESGADETPASPRCPIASLRVADLAGEHPERPERNHPYVSASFVNQLARDWTGRLAHYATHRNDEHRLALLEEAARYAGLHLENDLARSEFWSRSPLHQRAAVLLFLVDRGVVERTTRRGRRVYEPLAHAESWSEDQPSLRPYRGPVLEFLNALRLELQRRAHSWQV